MNCVRALDETRASCFVRFVTPADVTCHIIARSTVVLNQFVFCHGVINMCLFRLLNVSSIVHTDMPMLAVPRDQALRFVHDVESCWKKRGIEPITFVRGLNSIDVAGTCTTRASHQVFESEVYN